MDLRSQCIIVSLNYGIQQAAQTCPQIKRDKAWAERLPRLPSAHDALAVLNCALDHGRCLPDEEIGLSDHRSYSCSPWKASIALCFCVLPLSRMATTASEYSFQVTHTLLPILSQLFSRVLGTCRLPLVLAHQAGLLC